MRFWECIFSQQGCKAGFYNALKFTGAPVVFLSSITSPVFLITVIKIACDSSLPSELYLKKTCSDTWTRPNSLGLRTVISAYRLDNKFLTFISSPWGSSLSVTVSPGWSRQQNCDSPSVLFNREETD